MWLYRQGLTTRSLHSDMHSIANDIAEAMVGGDQLCVKTGEVAFTLYFAVQ